MCIPEFDKDIFFIPRLFEVDLTSVANPKHFIP